MGAGRGPARRARAAGARRRGHRISTPRWPPSSRTSPTSRSSSTRMRRRGLRAVRAAHRRGAQPRHARLRGRLRRHAAHVADALVHRLAVRVPGSTRRGAPRPTARNFQLQHWTHAFDYALVSGDGDWRQADIPARSAEFSRPLLAVAENTRAAGGLPAWGSLLEIEPAGKVALGALKAAGNPLAAGQRPARRSRRRCRGPAGRNMRWHHRCRGPVRAAPHLCGLARRPARAATGARGSPPDTSDAARL